jgi:hypothetical protein
VFDVAEQHEDVRVCRINYFQEAFEPVSTPAPEMQAMSREVSLYAEMEVCNNQQP